MDGLIALRWPMRMAPSGLAKPLPLAMSAAVFVTAATVVFHLGELAGQNTLAPKATPAATQPAPPPSAFVDQTIRVLLFEQVSQCQLGINAPFDVVDPEERRVLLRCNPTRQFTVRFENGVVHLPEFECSFSARVVDLVPTTPATFRIPTSKGPRSFAGTIRLLPRGAAAGSILNLVDMEIYLLGVVPAEALRGFHEQAMRAQAIVARTYAWYTKLTAGLRCEWDVKADESSQMYIGMAAKPALAEKAVRDTRGVVCTWNSPTGERIFCTYYSSTCGGCTQDAGPVKNEASIPPLVGRVHCEYCRASPFYRWEPVRLEKWLISQRLRDKYVPFRSLGRIESMDVLEATPEGRPVRFAFADAEGRVVELEAENFRLSVDPTGRNVRSTFFTPVVDKNSILLTNGHGFGHGMGLCQYGAAALADGGWQAGQILRFYYPGSHLTRAY